MKKKVICLKFFLLILIFVNVISLVIINDYIQENNFKVDSNIQKTANLCFYEDTNYILVEKNNIQNSFYSYLYKDDKDDYFSKIYDYNTNEEMNLNMIIKEEKIDDYNLKINELIKLKYPKFISDILVGSDVKKSYIFRENELVIYFNDYDITPKVTETLYLIVNYNEIKDYLNFTFILDENYENEIGYNYTNSKKSVAFTFDDSPNIGKTDQILTSLKDNYFHATFFVLGNKMVQNIELLKNIKNDGNEIGSHTYNHKNYKKMSDEEIEIDYKNMNEIYYSLFNENIKLIRPPYGSYKKNQLSLIDCSFVLWSMDTLDWKYRDKEYLINYVLNNIKDGDIILFHDTHSSTVLAVNELLPILYANGYQVMSVSELASLKGYNLENNAVYYNFS